MTDDQGRFGAPPPDLGEPLPRLDLEPEGDEEDGIEPIAAESDDEWGVDDPEEGEADA